jgi:DNA transformation protein
MPKRSEFVEHVLELMRPLGAVQARRMFGGWGLYREGTFFALILADTLYFKADEASRARFEQAGGGRFTYRGRGGKEVGLGYYQPPDEALESREAMVEWARLGYAAALRSAVRKKRRANRKER